MKRDRGVDYARIFYKPGVGYCRCPVCSDFDSRQRQGEEVGIDHGEVPDGCQYVNREMVFANHWERENDDNGSVLAVLIASGKADPKKHPEVAAQLKLFDSDPWPSKRERAVAATAVQWLGTNVGWCFLEQAVKECGYRIIFEEDFERIIEARGEILAREARTRASEEISAAEARASDQIVASKEELRIRMEGLDEEVAQRCLAAEARALDAERRRLEAVRLQEDAEARLEARAAVAFGRLETLEDEDE